MVVRFDMEYPSVWADADLVRDGRPVRYGVDRRIWAGAKGRPDLAIEVWDDQHAAEVPRIVVLDATWSGRLDNQAAKFLYREAIRDFTRYEPSGKPARPVVASWAVYPGPPEEADYEEDFRTGRLPLDPTPDAAEVLAPYLERMLALAGAL